MGIVGQALRRRKEQLFIRKLDDLGAIFTFAQKMINNFIQ